MRCGDCQFWGTDKDDPTDEFRACRGIPMSESRYSEDIVEDHPDDLAVAVDGSGYFAAMKSRADFGCVLFHPKEVE